MPTIWHDLLYLFYPRHCLLCQKTLVENEQQICLHCLYDLPRVDYHKRTDNPIVKMFAGIPQIRYAAAFLLYEKEGVVQTLIHSLKYRNNLKLAEQLGRMAALEFQRDGMFQDVDLVIPVPLHPRKRRKRGYNQSEMVARGVASVYNLPVISNLLYRNAYTSSQTKKSLYERHLNVEKIFSLAEPGVFSGKHILLIDDVITTGATSQACLKVLTKVADIRISLFALSIVEIK